MEVAPVAAEQAAASAVDALDRTTSTHFIKELIARRENLVDSVLQGINGIVGIVLGAAIGFKSWGWSLVLLALFVGAAIVTHFARGLRQGVLARVRSERDEARFALAEARRTGGRGPGASQAFRVLRQLHKAWFPGSRDHLGLSPDYRLSLFIPDPNSAAPKRWRCLAWTDDRRPGRPANWEVGDRREIGQCGVVVYTFLEGTSVSVPGVPAAQRDEADPAECARYRREACVTLERHQERSWRWATLQTYFARGQTGAIACILVVERESGGPIDGDDQLRDRELQLAADFWAAATEQAAHEDDQDPDPS